MIVNVLNVNKYKLCEFCTIPPTIPKRYQATEQTDGRKCRRTRATQSAKGTLSINGNDAKVKVN